GDRPLEIVYDHEATRCASHLGPCDPDAFEPPTTSFDDWLDPDDLRMSEVRVAGYLRELARLVIVVASRHHRYVVGLHATEPPAVLHYGGGFDSGPATDLLPNYLQATGHDDYVWMGHTVVVTQTPGGPDDTTLVQGGAYRAWSGYAQLADLGGFARTYLRPPVAFWGDVLVIPDGDTGAPWELVRYDDFAQPGDVLFLGYVSVSLDYFRGNYMLFQSGPRGGLAPTWREERGGTDIWGLDVDADGDACVAERVPGDVVFLAAAPNALFTPSVQVDAWALPGVVDCRLTGDGGALALTADPPGLWRFADAHTAPEQVEALAGAPLTFVTERDGSLGVLSEEDGLRGRLVLRDGREVTIAAGSWGVQVDGREVARLDDMLGSAAANEGWARLVERPDGLVAVAPYGVRLPPGQGHLASPRVVDVDTGAVYRLTDRAFRVDLGAPVAVIPGGHGGDPWAPSLASGRP
ncbi:MAG: hypothetical protein KC635_29935, partial [Myxococcales bacterium]|nr:hypothetical protein [Myxococcales bacterium]